MQQEVKSLEHQLTILQLRDGLGSTSLDLAESRNKARARVNRLMREVDKCISLLSTEQEGAERG